MNGFRLLSLQRAACGERDSSAVVNSDISTDWPVGVFAVLHCAVVLCEATFFVVVDLFVAVGT